MGGVADEGFAAGGVAGEGLGAIAGVAEFGFEAAVAERDDGAAAERAGGGVAGVGEGGFDADGACGGGVWGDDDLAFETALEDGFIGALFEGVDPLDHFGDLIAGVVAVGEHGDGAPDTGGAALDAIDAGVEGTILAAVFVSDFEEGGADDAVFGGVAVEAVGAFHEREPLGFDAAAVEGSGDEETRAEAAGFGGRVTFFGVGDGGAPFDGLAWSEEVAVGWGGEGDDGRGIACDDGDGGCGGSAGGVGDGEFEDVVAGVGESDLGVRIRGEGFAVEFPVEAEGCGVAVGVGGTFAREGDLEGDGAAGRGGGGGGERRDIAVGEGDAEESGVGIGSPCFAVVETVEIAVRAELGVEETLEGDGGGEGFDGDEVRVLVETGPADDAAFPVPPEETVVEVGGEAVGLFEFRFEVEDWACAGGAAALADFGEFFGSAVGVVDEGGDGGREVFGSGIVDAVVARVGGVEGSADFFRGVVVVGVGEVVADEVGPAVVAGFFGLIDFVVAARAAGAVAAGVGADLAPVDEAGGLIDAHAPWVAAAHAEDFGAGAGGAGREEIAVWDGDGAVVLRADAEDFAAEVIGIGGGFLGVPRFHVRAFVEGSEALGVAVRVGIVAGGDEETAIGAEFDGTGVVAAFAALFAEGEEDFLAFEVEGIAVHGEAAEALAVDVFGRVVEVDPVVGGEFGIEGEAEEAIFLSGGGVDGAGFDDGAGVWFPDAEFAGDFDEEDAAVGCAFELHGLGHALGEDLDLPARVRGRVGGEGDGWERESWKCQGGQQGRKAHRADTARGGRVVMRKGGRMSGGGISGSVAGRRIRLR